MQHRTPNQLHSTVYMNRKESSITKKFVIFTVGRDAKTGRFIAVKEAQRRKKTAIVETIKRRRR